MANLYAGLIACILNIVSIPLIIFVANKRGWFDKVSARKIHTGQIPRLGGVGIFWSFAVTLLLVAAFSRGSAKDALAYWPVGVAMLLVHVVGLVDDFHDLRAKFKFLAHLAASIVVVSAGYRFRTLFVPGLGELALGFWSYPLTVIWLVGVINALNMIDGMDGLSGGISIIGAFALGVILLQGGLGTPAVAAIALVGSLAGYLFYNYPPAKIFMGDSGSTFLGFALALLPLMDRNGGNGFWFWDGVTVLLLPIFDVFAAMIRRTRKGVSMMSPDRWHFHHKMLRLGLGTRAVLAVAYTICMVLGMVAISVLFLPPVAHFILVLSTWTGLLIRTVYMDGAAHLFYRAALCQGTIIGRC